jgi:hypothetical protein
LRRKNDLYETSELAVKELLSRISIKGALFECCAGKGAISFALRKFFPESAIFTNDIDQSLPASHHFDASKIINWVNYTLPSQNETIDWTITNPPFNKAFPILLNAYEHSNLGVAFLLRLSFLEPTYERQDWLNEHPPDSLIVLPRYSFTGNGKTDSVTCAWMIWDKRNAWKESRIYVARKNK